MLTKEQCSYKIVPMAKNNVGRFLRPRTFGVLAVAFVFALGGLFGGLLAPIAKFMSAADTGNVVVANIQISNLPRNTVKISDTISIPTVTGTATKKLFVIESPRASQFPSSTYTGDYSSYATQTYNVIGGVGNYEWRFYQGSDLVHTHAFNVYQDRFTFAVPTSQYNPNDGEVSWIPNVTDVENHPILFPLPDKFTDNKGNDLFDNETKDVVKLRQSFLDAWTTGFQHYKTYDNDGVETSIAGRPDLFKYFVLANTKITFPGNSNSNAGGYIVENGVTTLAQSLANRKFKPMVAGRFYAKYTLVGHPMLRAEFDTAQVTAEAVTDVEQKIVYKLLPSFDTNLNGSELSFNQEFTIPMPTINVASSWTDIGQYTKPDEVAWNPVIFTDATSVTNYTRVRVDVFPLNGDMTEANRVETIWVTEQTNYKFTPTRAGRYTFRYYTTTLFGVGYKGHYETYLEAPEYADIDGTKNANGRFFVYYGQSVMTVNRNMSAPELKWTVPFEYDAQDANKAKAIDTTNDLFFEQPVIAGGDLLEYYAAANNFERRDTFNRAPDLSNYLPNTGTGAKTQVLSNGKFVLPALLGLGNISTGKDLQYVVRFTRGTSINSEMITFDSKVNPTDVGSNYKPYDNSKPLVIDFNNYTVTNGTLFQSANDGNVLTTWKSSTKIKKNTTYQIEVYAKDDDGLAKTLFPNVTNAGRTSNIKTYSFTVVDATNSDEYKTSNDPIFNGSINMDRTSYYVGDTISFREIGVYDNYTSSVGVDYYLAYKLNNVDKFVKLTARDNIRGGMVSYDLDGTDDLSAALSGKGELSVTVVAFAKNYYALHKQINPLTFAKDPSGYFAFNSATLLDTQKFDGIAKTTLNIKLYELSYGDKARIGFLNKTGDDFGDLDDVWEEYFDDNSVSIVERGNDNGYELPTIVIGYGKEFGTGGFDFDDDEDVPSDLTVANAYDTTVTIKLIAPNGTSVGTGLTDGFRNLSIRENMYKAITGLKFNPTQIGDHKFVITVNNTGHYVSVLTATIRVIGSPVITPIINSDGMTTVRIGQTAVLPSVSAFINGREFKTNASNGIVPKDGTTVVGDYSIIGNFSGTEFSGIIGNQFIPYAEGTYTFTYTLTFTPTANGFSEVNGGTPLDNMAGVIVKSPTNVVTETHILNVTALQNGDLSIVIKDDADSGYTYEDIVADGTNTYVQAKVDTDKTSPTYNQVIDYPTSGDDEPRTNTLKNYNIVPGLTPAVQHDVKDDDLNMGLEFVEHGTSKALTDVYEFGPIFLPNMQHIWNNNLNMSGSDFNFDEAHRVTVAHSTNPQTNIFDSSRFDAETKPEVKIAKINGKSYYYFQPEGKINVRRPNETHIMSVNMNQYVADELDTRLSLFVTGTYDPTTKLVDAKMEAGVLYPSGYDNGMVYFYNVNDQDLVSWFQINYNDPDYKPAYNSVSSLVDPNVKPDGIYTVTYTLSYGGITATAEYKIGVGDMHVPTIRVADTRTEKLFTKPDKAWRIGDTFVLRTSDVQVLANGGTMTARSGGYYADWWVSRNLNVGVTRPDGQSSLSPDLIIKRPEDEQLVLWTRDRAEAEKNAIVFYDYNEDGWVISEEGGAPVSIAGKETMRTWSFKLEQSGDYRITLTIPSETGVTASVSYTITVEGDKAGSRISPQTIWGTVLIVITSGLLIGVIVYFIQSGRKTKFAPTSGSPKPEKPAKAPKEPKEPKAKKDKSVKDATPETAETTPEDAPVEPEKE